MPEATPFSPQAVSRFVFLDHVWSPGSGVLQLNYALDDDLRLTERIVFPPPHNLDDSNVEALQRCFDLIHWLAGISYFKTCVPRSIEFTGVRPSPRAADFLKRVYTRGLAEFAFENDLQLSDRIQFSSGDGWRQPEVRLAPGNVVPLGGGKDSLVSCDLLDRQQIGFRTIAVGQAPLITEVAAHLSQPHLRIERHLDSRLGLLNRQGAYNGHVPITAILAAVLVAGGLIYGYDTVVMSNERSASEANLELADGSQVNHQWSKSLEFEQEFAALVDSDIVPGFRYFSLLRGWSEIRIARHFAGMPALHEVFSSCNRNFVQGGEGAARRWCRDCPKCRFVALALAPHLGPDRLEAIMGAVLLDDPAQVPGFRALAGIDSHKPFECVGELAESRALLRALGETGDWSRSAVIRELAPLVADASPLNQFMGLAEPHRVPDEFLPACS